MVKYKSYMWPVKRVKMYPNQKHLYTGYLTQSLVKSEYMIGCESTTGMYPTTLHVKMFAGLNMNFLKIQSKYQEDLYQIVGR